MPTAATAPASYAYLIAPSTLVTNVTLTLTQGGNFTASGPFTYPANAGPSQTVTPGQAITLYSPSGYIDGYISCNYNGAYQQCAMNFMLAGSPPWDVDSSGGFSNSAIIGGYDSSTANNIPVVPPQSQGGGGTPSSFPVLDQYMVSLVDYYPLVIPGDRPATYLFRGNVPFTTPPKANGTQSVDFTQLDAYLRQVYGAQTGNTDFPAIGDYLLVDICLQDLDSESGSIQWELNSFGATQPPVDTPLTALAGGAAYPPFPETPWGCPALKRGAQMINWPVEPHGQQGNSTQDQGWAQQLSALMTAPQFNIPTVYYIHCASGHDRTGLLASAYLVANRQLSLQRALIQGTTLYLWKPGMPPAGGQLCYPCNLIVDGQPTTTPTTLPQARMTMIAEVYAQTVANIYNLINGTNETVPANATNTNPAYVYASYPWTPGNGQEKKG